MAFPTVESITESNSATEVAEASVDMPATVNSGDLLIIFITENDTGIMDTPSGWTEAYQSNTDTSITRGACFYKTSDGTEGGTTVTINFQFVTKTFAAHTYRITGWNAIEFGTATTQGVITNPDPPSLSPSYGADDTLWIAVAHVGDDDETATNAPTDYTNLTDTITGAGTNNGATIATARRENNTATEDPGAFTMSESGATLVNTVAVQGVAGGTNFDGSVSFGHTLGLSPSASAAAIGGVTNAQTMGMSDQGGATTLASLEQAISLALQTSGAISFEGNITIDVTYGQGSSATAQTSAELSGAENVTLFHAYTMSTSAQSSASGLTSIDLTYDANAGGQASVNVDSEIDIGFDQSTEGVVGVTNFNAAVSLGALTYQTSITGTASTVASTAQSIQYALDSIAAAAVSSNTTITYINDISASATVITVDVTLADGRTLTIKMQNRTLSIDSENRTLTIDP